MGADREGVSLVLRNNCATGRPNGFSSVGSRWNRTRTAAESCICGSRPYTWRPAALKQQNATYTRSLSELRAAYGDRSALLLQPLLGLAWLHMETDRVELAERDFAQASSLEQSESDRGPPDPAPHRSDGAGCAWQTE